jgi:hypothetical protein
VFDIESKSRSRPRIAINDQNGKMKEMTFSEDQEFDNPHRHDFSAFDNPNR